jgi:putative ABC transport system permease protein
MESGKRRFSLEAAILEWKKSMASSPTLEDGQIAELETSLRDEVRDLVGRGVEEEAAFRRAASEMGPPARAGAEFDKVYGRKPRFVPALAWNYFKVAARHLRRARGFSVINIAGLAVGLACCLLILFWVMDEFGYDRHHLRADRISRLAYEETVDGVQSRLAMVTYAAAPAFTAEIPEIEEYARMVRTSPLVAVEGRVWDERGFYYTDPGFFKIFSHRFLGGDATTALDAPGSIVLTEATARRLFGRTDVVGRTLTLNRTTDFRVSGVIADVPARSHFKFNALASLLTFQNDRRFQNILSDWNRINGWSYLLLKSGADPRNVERKMDAVAVARAGEDFAGSRSPAFRLQKLTDIRLRSRLGTEIEPTGDIRQVYIFSTIAVFILLLAGINFANLSTARSAVRTREIGVRKVLGARRKSLVIQFLGESLFISALALVGAFVLAALALPAFNRLSGKSLTLGSILTPAAGCGAIGLALVCGLGSGFYPAFFLPPHPRLEGKTPDGGAERSLARPSRRRPIHRLEHPHGRDAGFVPPGPLHENPGPRVR